MFMTDIEMDGASLGSAQAAMTRISEAVASLHLRALPLIAADFHRMEARRFDAEGPGWAPLSATTRSIRARRGSDSDRILVDHGTLVGSLTMTQAQGAVMRVDGEEMFVGTDVGYAQYHQEGPREIKVFGRGRATLPERKLVEVTEEDAARMAAIVMAAMRPGTKFGTAELSAVQLLPEVG